MLEVQVNVQIGFQPEVVSLVSAILNRQGAVVEAPVQAAATAPAEEQPEAPATPAVKRGRKPKQETPAESAAQGNDHEPEASAPGDMPDEVFYPSEEDVRTAMHNARCRIEGPDYKDKPSDDMHRAMTDAFKRIADALSGQKKPSALPPEKRQAFIDAAETIQAAPGTTNLTYSLK